VKIISKIIDAYKRKPVKEELVNDAETASCRSCDIAQSIDSISSRNGVIGSVAEHGDSMLNDGTQKAAENEDTKGDLDALAKKVKLGELQMQSDAAKQIIELFKQTNRFVLMFLILVLMIDTCLYLVKDTPISSRLINTEVILALIGATIIQLGTIMLSISRFLFPNKDKSNGDSDYQD